MSERSPRGLASGLVSICLSLMVAAIALSVALDALAPYMRQLVAVGGLLVLLSGYRAWQRSRW